LNLFQKLHEKNKIEVYRSKRTRAIESLIMIIVGVALAVLVIRLSKRLTKQERARAIQNQ
jgi:uncharacterized membrane-anchored protein YhcB (DUF1043 family)